ncbi:2-hydroxychromene-2-carboxylate isomerase [Microbulbifer variabilis]|uniref:2-hydroxychromene-2-carboxylate isomerase n=1 Tax=Microbulbifer variabilis TaxID=266805 RepID=UPI00036DEFC1|nr:2-hydroxychromene-2-carboxylate isomerase [Microbulbifer variabilis]
MKIDFWFEFGSTYSYPVAMKIEKMVTEQGGHLEWKPFLLGPIFSNQGWHDSPFNIYPEKGKYMWRDLERICEADGLNYKKPTSFPRNGLKAARIACLFSGEKWVPEFIRSVYAANFELDLDISLEEILKKCLPFSDEESFTKIKRANTSLAKQMLKENTDQAKKKGIFGAPTFMVGDEKFWGGDRLHAAIQWAKNNQ